MQKKKIIKQFIINYYISNGKILEKKFFLNKMKYEFFYKILEN